MPTDVKCLIDFRCVINCMYYLLLLFLLLLLARNNLSWQQLENIGVVIFIIIYILSYAFYIHDENIRGHHAL